MYSTKEIKQVIQIELKLDSSKQIHYVSMNTVENLEYIDVPVVPRKWFHLQLY